MGQAFMSFGQVYGSASDAAHLQSQFAHIAGGHGALAFEGYRLTQTLMLAPALPIALLIALIVAVRRRDPRLLAPMASLASILAFQDFFFVSGGSYGWLRFSIAAVPLAWLLAALPLAGRADMPQPRRVLARFRHSLTTVILATLALCLVLPSVLTAALAMTSSRLAREEAPQFDAIGAVLAGHPRTGPLLRWDGDDAVARAIAAMHLPHGSVLLDATDGFAIILASHDPSTYVITPDRDFKATLADPALWNVRYLLVAPTHHVIEQAYPGMFETGARIGQLVRDFPGTNGGYEWRLYRIEKPRVTVG
jgi:hypothetical protein